MTQGLLLGNPLRAVVDTSSPSPDWVWCGVSETHLPRPANPLTVAFRVIEPFGWGSQPSTVGIESRDVFALRDVAGPTFRGVKDLSVLWELVEQALSTPASTITPLSTSTPPPVEHRRRELEWRSRNAERIRQLAGNWIALEGDELLCHGPVLRDVVEAARARGVSAPFVLFAGDIEADLVRMGL